ncbi:uncharacterized protein [Scyliorhinus torazame]|uniref:uncharacterized protein n=1 Tax=Scyliorhinus torazame TaxID=75743 RepID=UPI003B5A9BA4
MVNQQHEYKLEVALNVTENDMSKIRELPLKLLQRLSHPINLTLENGTFNITGITLTTVCQHVNNETQCRCDGGFIWNSTFCSKHQSCSVNITDDRSCDCIRNEPTEGPYCDLPTVSTTPTQSTVPTTTPRNTTPTITPTTVSTTPTTVPTTPTTVSTIKLTIQEKQNHALRILTLIFTDDLKNSSSTLFKNKTKEFKELLQKTYRTVQSNAVVNILGYIIVFSILDEYIPIYIASTNTSV